mmetsp:Transcript_124037/g.247018  ORF Transcript_124037/g.247018 Transcript_124037/m.247018 type:complete len:200 (+) Transcript_124037:82-681(+)
MADGVDTYECSWAGPRGSGRVNLLLHRDGIAIVQASCTWQSRGVENQREIKWRGTWAPAWRSVIMAITEVTEDSDPTSGGVGELDEFKQLRLCDSGEGLRLLQDDGLFSDEGLKEAEGNVFMKGYASSQQGEVYMDMSQKALQAQVDTSKGNGHFSVAPEAVDKLHARFPQASRMVVSAALEKHRGHAGRAAAELRRTE